VTIQFFQHHILKRLSSFNVSFWHLCHKSDGYTCVGFFLHLLFHSIDLHVCFWVSIMLFLLLWLWKRQVLD
jgi:hypothetical protein